MYLLPAIDLLDGRAVRLAKGDYNAVTVYNENPVAQAEQFAEQGAEWIHVVDLDGARTGTPHNTALIEAIISATGLNIEVGGGVRSLATIEHLLNAGAKRVVLGTKLIVDPDFAREACKQFGEAICAGVDARGGEVAIEGWREGAGVPAEELVGELASWGIRHLVYTDIARDGMQTGIDALAYEALARRAGFPVIASGGVSTLDDLRALCALPSGCIEGVIAGRALYEGSFTVAEAVKLLYEEMQSALCCDTCF
ncbi:MAG: 1-(5-phosphoribosyl)-5-[(5-phosphoribosylamino)methylideneamino]imidazole-4-carboxamide isomerase [Coriobacteriia bacterium]|jgi:phosphoribosylformimino-5-aminoimidazole carboxamide ribotide isomerase|nr:1-(5-phosphoribosyl)-5-[(5-phosphoribosylamino)methylideneamino]imidazole-4-carboxamide isomerase [Coriobacteriia bacterium]MDR2714310.1 1-(5-phosphoribosyl)-5-[(5-phosphoribosylamino)methylideneamino]imidazole-4-carboxamide isomerase [Coriobacteriales bacterium]